MSASCPTKARRYAEATHAGHAQGHRGPAGADRGRRRRPHAALQGRGGIRRRSAPRQGGPARGASRAGTATPHAPAISGVRSRSAAYTCWGASAGFDASSRATRTARQQRPRPRLKPDLPPKLERDLRRAEQEEAASLRLVRELSSIRSENCFARADLSAGAAVELHAGAVGDVEVAL
jgi:hypothetical protein